MQIDIIKKSIASIVLTYWFGTVPLRTGVGGGRRGIIKSLSIPLAHTVYIHNMLRHKQWRNLQNASFHHSSYPIQKKQQTVNAFPVLCAQIVIYTSRVVPFDYESLNQYHSGITEQRIKVMCIPSEYQTHCGMFEPNILSFEHCNVWLLAETFKKCKLYL